MRKILQEIPSFLRLSAAKQGSAPGTLEHIGEQKVDDPTIMAWSYDKDSFDEQKVTEVSELESLLKDKREHWINVVGLHDPDLIKEIGQQFGLHALLLEGVLNTAQRPKIEEYDDCLFIVVKMLHYEGGHTVSTEQVSIVLKENLLISFQEKPQDVFDTIRERLRGNKGRLRKSGADYLAYRMIDAVVDGYTAVLEPLGDEIEEVEQQSLEKPDDQFITTVYQLRRQSLFIRKAVYPLRDVLVRLERAESELIDDTNVPFFRDVYDHTLQATDAIDTFRDLLSNMLDNYLSVMSHRTNAVMKVLTVMASIFIPLTFIAGVYGMNFKNMPELDWEWGYPAVWGVMIVLTIGMIIYFQRKKWM